MRFDADHLTQRFGNMARNLIPSDGRSERQKAEMDAVAAILRGDHYAWLTPSMFDPDAQRLRDKYPAAGTTRIKWQLAPHEIAKITHDLRTTDLAMGYTKNDHLFYGYGGLDSELVVRKPVTHKLKVGESYKTQDGKNVTITEARHTPGYECVLGDDDIWRYNREGDRGRVTGTAHDFSDPRNLIPEASIHEYIRTVDSAVKGMKTGRISGRGAGMSQIPRGVVEQDGAAVLPEFAQPDMAVTEADLEKTMTELPQWVEGLPLLSGYRGERYDKDVVVPAVFNGKVVRYHADAAKIGKGLLWDRPRALAYGIDRGMPVEEFNSDDSITRVWTPGDAVPDEARPYMDPHITLKQFADRFSLTPPEDTLAEEIKADVERAAKLAAKTPPGFVSYEDAKAQGLVDEDPWPTTEEILAAHAAKHYADGVREDAERDLARIEARNAFKVALRKSAITASLIMIGGVAACFAVGLIGALVYTAFNYFAPHMEGSDTAATTGFYLILALFGLMVGLLVGTSNRR